VIQLQGPNSPRGQEVVTLTTRQQGRDAACLIHEYRTSAETNRAVSGTAAEPEYSDFNWPSMLGKSNAVVLEGALKRLRVVSSARAHVLRLTSVSYTFAASS
jgi:hypothetical protein